MTRYTVTTCPGCGRRMAVNGRTTCVRASRSTAHFSDSALGARERDGARSSEASEPLSAVAPAAKPMPTSRRMRSRREAARSASGG